VRATGDPVIVTLAVMVAVPVAAPVAVGVKATLMVQELFAARVVPVQVESLLKNKPSAELLKNKHLESW
jgi:hypothetical protein